MNDKKNGSGDSEKKPSSNGVSGAPPIWRDTVQFGKGDRATTQAITVHTISGSMARALASLK